MDQKKITLSLPSTFTLNNTSTENYFDTNYYFWDAILNKSFLNKLYSDYKLLHPKNHQRNLYFEYIIQNFELIRTIIHESCEFPYEEQRTIYYFYILQFVIDVFNVISKSQSLSLAYGAYKSKLHTATNIRRELLNTNNFIYSFILNIIKKNPLYFSNNTEFVFSFRWENELIPILLFAKLLKKTFSNVSCSINFENANEQVDFTYWENIPLIQKQIEHMYNLKKNINHQKNPVFLEKNIYGTKLLYLRLQNEKCSWGKCTFCTINSNHTEGVSTDLNIERERTLDKAIFHLKRNPDIKLLIFQDEAIHYTTLLCFAKAVIKEKLNIRWGGRTRFSAKITPSIAKILGKSGLRYLGLGLESPNQRILSLMNKYPHKTSSKEFANLLTMLDAHNINPHTYLILGFPSETIPETQENIDFAVNHLYTLRFFSYSANRFYLMKGSEIYKNPGKYNLKINEPANSFNIGGVRFQNNSKVEQYSQSEIKKISHELYSRMFYANNHKEMSRLGNLFWEFIDRTGIFYHHKLLNENNPYWPSQKVKHKKLTNNLLNEKFKILPLMETDIVSTPFFDLKNMNILETHNDTVEILKGFLQQYSSDMTLSDNLISAQSLISNNNRNKRAKLKVLVLDLINRGCLYRNRSINF